MYVANIRVTHKTAPHNVLSSLNLTEAEHQELIREMLELEEINEALLLQTCNRFEIYYSGHDIETGSQNAREFFLTRFGAEIDEHCVMDRYLETMAHLFRAVSSVDSMIVGENQIQAQVKEAFNYAMEKDHSGRVLNEVFRRALSIGKRVRTETHISDGKVSISSAAVDLANEHVPLKGKKIMIIGAGVMSNLVANHLKDFEPGELVVIGRTPERVETFCTEHCGRASTHDEIIKELADTDVLFSATSCPRILVTKATVEDAIKNRPHQLALIDIAMPADIDPACSELPNVTAYCIDDLSGISEENKAKRQEAIKKVEGIIEEELRLYRKHLQTAHVDMFISPMTQYIEEIREQEVERALRMLGDPDHRTKEIVEGLSKSLTKKIMFNFFSGVRKSPVNKDEMQRFSNIFMGNGNVSGNKDEKTKKQCPHTGHGN